MFNKFASSLRKANRYLKLLRDLVLIRASSLFNAAWYLANNPDVAHAKVNPALHYLRFGGFEGRDPSPDFSSRWYIDINEDVRNAGINPLVHYLIFGQKEGREARPPGVDIDSLPIRSLSQNTLGFRFIPNRFNKQKIFCIGYNKTGTTSLEQAFKDLGYKVGFQPEAELLMDDWALRDFRRIIKYCTTADAFQDLPFSVDFTYQILDYAFPNSKFILTVRTSADEWYKSYVRFYGKFFGVSGIPTADDLKNSSYVSKGWIWRQERNIFGIDESNLFDKKIYETNYIGHNDQILQYFKFRSKDLLVLNLANPSAMQELCEFLGKEYTGQKMPHLNKSGD